MPKLTSAVTGLAGFAAAHQVMSMIDPEHSIPELPALLTEGALAGGIGTGILKMLGSSTYFAPEIIGGAVGYYVGAKTSQAWSNWMRELGTSEQFANGSGAVIGGAAGGASGALAGMATSFALFGTALGRSRGERFSRSDFRSGHWICGMACWRWNERSIGNNGSRSVQVRRQIRVQELDRLQTLIQDNEKAKSEGRSSKSRDDSIGDVGELLLAQGADSLSGANSYAKNMKSDPSVSWIGNGNKTIPTPGKPRGSMASNQPSSIPSFDPNKP